MAKHSRKPTGKAIAPPKAKEREVEESHSGRIEVRDLPDDEKERLLGDLAETLGVKLLSQEEFDAQVEHVAKDDTEEVLKEIGIDLDSRGPVIDTLPLDVLVDKMAKSLDIAMLSTHWKGGAITDKEKTALYGVRVFIRQIRGEKAPPGQAATLGDMLSSGHKIPTNVLTARGVPARSMKVNADTFERAGATV